MIVGHALLRCRLRYICGQRHTVMAGAPAKRIGWMSRAGVRFGQNRICPVDGNAYRQVAQNTIEEVN